MKMRELSPFLSTCTFAASNLTDPACLCSLASPPSSHARHSISLLYILKASPAAPCSGSWWSLFCSSCRCRRPQHRRYLPFLVFALSVTYFKKCYEDTGIWGNWAARATPKQPSVYLTNGRKYVLVEPQVTWLKLILFTMPLEGVSIMYNDWMIVNKWGSFSTLLSLASITPSNEATISFQFAAFNS